jgi:hypothetical protein
VHENGIPGDLVLRWRTHDLGHRVEMERLAKTLRRLRNGRGDVPADRVHVCVISLDAR